LNQALNLQAFEPGALLIKSEKEIDFANPFARPATIVDFMRGDWASFADKLRLARVFLSNLDAKKYLPLDGRNLSTLDFLRDSGFGEKAIETFFRPFFAGVFLEDRLETSAALLRHLLINFSFGKATLPLQGMGAIPLYMAKGLQSDKILLGAEVKVEAGKTFLNGEHMPVRLLVDTTNKRVPTQDWNGSLTVYFSCAGRRLHSRLVVDADSAHLVRTAVCLSSVSENYAPSGKNLISCTLKMPSYEVTDLLIERVKFELGTIYKRQTNELEFMRHYYVKEALPSFLPRNQDGRGVKREGDCIIAGDSATYPSINGALLSGRQAADLAITALKN
jgi:hypothetical protein